MYSINKRILVVGTCVSFAYNISNINADDVHFCIVGCCGMLLMRILLLLILTNAGLACKFSMKVKHTFLFKNQSNIYKWTDNRSINCTTAFCQRLHPRASRCKPGIGKKQQLMCYHKLLELNMFGCLAITLSQASKHVRLQLSSGFHITCVTNHR